LIRFSGCLPPPSRASASAASKCGQASAGAFRRFVRTRAPGHKQPLTCVIARMFERRFHSVNGHPIVKDERLVIGRSRHWDRPGSSSPNVADCRRWRPGSIRRQLSLSTDSHSRPKPIIKLFRQRSFARPVRLNDGADCVRCTWATRGYF
jgi:hypothetical protein